MLSYTETTYECDEIFEMQEIAATIRKQIGMRTLMACGAREWQFPTNAKGIIFKVGNGRLRLHIKVILTSMDDYSVSLIKLGRVDTKIVEHYDGIYCDQLSEIVYKMVNK